MAGYDKPLYILPFDHRESFETGMFGWQEPLTDEQTAAVAAEKRVIYDGFVAAVEGGVPKDRAGILVDEQFGAAILRDATAAGYLTAMSVEKSGQAEFEFQYGDDFGAHIEAFNPTFAKVLVRYNPAGDADLNARQTGRLKTLSDWLHANNRMLMFELLVPATPDQLAQAGSQSSYDQQARPGLMVAAIEQIQDAGVEPDVWKIEGLDSRDDCVRIVAAARRNGRDRAGCIILGRGENEAKVREWLSIAASVPGFIGFAVGRTTFWSPLANLREGVVTREQAVAQIAARYGEWVNLFAAKSAEIRP
jgi:5-dehydro-2-deoxygluconokinase